MSILASLRSRVFVAIALVSVLSLGLAMRLAARRVTAQARAEALRGLEESSRLVVENHQARFATLATLARLIADLPKLKAAVATADPPTVRPLAEDYRRRAGADVLLVADAQGRLLAAVGAAGTSPDEAAAVSEALAGTEARGFHADGTGVTQRVSVPIVVGPDPPEVLGALIVGFRLDDALAARYRAATGSEVALALGDRVCASTLPRSFDSSLVAVARSGAATTVVLDGEEFDALRRPLTPGGGSGPLALVLRSRAQGRRLLDTLRAALVQAGLVSVLIAVLLSLALAGSVTRPLAALTEHMRSIASSGDLSRKLVLPGRWHDEDARLLAGTFHSLTEALERSRREAAQRERLSALGRLSAVIAHEVRNPLMGIKGALRTLRQHAPDASDVREALDDVDHEVKRIDRIVEDVLDVARPPHLEPGPVELRELCRAAAEGALAGTDVAVEYDLAVAAVWTDGERLRTVMVNLLSNARDAAQAARAEGTSAPETPEIRLAARRLADGRVEIRVEDRGVGMTPEEAGAAFEPFVTGKRRGTGLGLAIARNVVEALGGTIRLEATPGRGATATVELPPHPPGAPTPRGASAR